MTTPPVVVEETCCCGASTHAEGTTWRAARAHVLAWRSAHKCPRRQAGDAPPGFVGAVFTGAPVTVTTQTLEELSADIDAEG